MAEEKSRRWAAAILLVYLFAAAAYGETQQPILTNEKKLINKLRNEYPEKIGRPLGEDINQTVTIYLRLQLIQIVALDAVNQQLETNIWSKYTWKDPYLSWDPNDFGGLQSIRIPASDAFQHDIKLLNNADQRLKEQRDALLVIYYNGDLLWMPTSLLRSTCYIDLKRFPFDKQNCSLIFGSWSYEKRLLDIDFEENLAKIDDSDYERSKEWRFLSGHAVKGVRIQDAKEYSELQYFLILERNPGFYTYLLIVPCVLLAVLTMVVFWLPPETPSKIILGMNVFSAFFLLLLLLAELVPTSTNEVPYIGIYFCLNMVMIALSLFLCTIVVHLYFRADTFCKVPPILKTIFLEGLARLYFMQPPRAGQSITQRTLMASGFLHTGKNVQNADKFEKFELLKERFKNYRENVLKVGFDNLLKTHPTITSSCTNINNNHHSSNFNVFAAAAAGTSATASSSPSPSNANLHKQTCCCAYCAYCSQQHAIIAEIAYLNNMEHDIKEIRDYLRDTRKKLETKEIKIKLASDWKQIALVLDRTFFFIYLFITVVTLVIMFPKETFEKKAVEIEQEATTAAAAAATVSTLASSIVDAVTSMTPLK